MYDRSKGKYGLHSKGQIVKIELWSESIEPQELHFHIKRKGEFSFVSDFVAFSDSKKELKKIRKGLTK